MSVGSTSETSLSQIVPETASTMGSKFEGRSVALGKEKAVVPSELVTTTLFPHKSLSERDAKVVKSSL